MGRAAGDHWHAREKAFLKREATKCYASIQGGIATSNSNLLPSPFFKIDENQFALEIAIMELTNWVEQRWQKLCKRNLIYFKHQLIPFLIARVNLCL
jgi:hypothetical protein